VETGDPTTNTKLRENELRVNRSKGKGKGKKKKKKKNQGDVHLQQMFYNNKDGLGESDDYGYESIEIIENIK
jgi:hypothetical protein